MKLIAGKFREREKSPERVDAFPSLSRFSHQGVRGDPAAAAAAAAGDENSLIRPQREPERERKSLFREKRARF
jgi:hypothetical protein